jgi:hypothetical protein
MTGFGSKLRRTTLWLFLLVMPIGVRVDPEHPGELTLSAHGGTGQVISVIRDCSGNAISSKESPYVDVAATMQFSHRYESGGFLAAGLRYGYLNSTAQRTVSGFPGGSFEEQVTYDYFNPYIAMESRYAGIGIGYMSGDVPMTFGDNSDSIPLSGHIRLGNYEKMNFLVSLNENLPLASGGGYFNMGLGYPAGRSVLLFTGLSAGFYDRPGFVQKVSILLSDRFDLDLSARVGSADDNFEGGFAAGLRYHIPVY